MLRVIPGFSLEPPASEVEFLRRELGITWNQIGEAELISRIGEAQRTLVIISEPRHYQNIVRKVESDSIVAVMISDESYSLDRLNLALHESVHGVYRHYAPDFAPWPRIISASLGYLRDSRHTSQQGSTVVPNIQSGLQLRRRMKAWQAIKGESHAVPLGYTDTFARAFSDRFGLAEDSSLLGHDEIASLDRTSSVVFRGNRGLAQRIVGCERAAEMENSDITLIDADWSARAAEDVGETYVDSLLHAQFALCPPGFSNNESFRFYEALLCGALPIEVRVATTHLGVLPWRDDGTICESSWMRGLDQATNMNETERANRVAASRALMERVLTRVAGDIRQDLRSG